MCKTSSLFTFHFSLFTLCRQFPLLLSVGLLSLQSLAAPLVLKDDFRSPRNKERPLRKATRLIVLHTTEAHAKSALNKLSERGEAHYCVTEKGEAYRIVDRDREAFHAGRSMWEGKEDCDEYSIGIEVVGYHDKSMPVRQLDALRELVARLKKLYGIPDARVVCHSHVAYGAPNTWHKKKHRGRKRCGMLFAMASVRAKLGLTARPAQDPDVKAKRLVQVDPYLDSILYGNVDTMAAFYGRGRPQTQISAAPAARTSPPKTAIKAAPPPSTRPKMVAAKTVAPKPSAPKVQAAQAKPVPPPVRKPPIVVPTAPPAAAPEDAKEEETDWLATMGLKGGYFKKKARLVVPKSSPEPPPAVAEGDVLPLPENLHVGRMGDDVKDLDALAKLPGYTRGGPVSATLSPFKIAGAAWRSASTYYYSPHGKITTGDKVDEKSVEAGTFVFFRK